MKVLITGITGFVGQNLKKYLKDQTIIGVSRQKSEKENVVSYDQVVQQLFDVKSCIHLAGKAHDLKKTTDDTNSSQEETKSAE